MIFVSIATADQSAAYISAQCCLECLRRADAKSMAAAAAAAAAVAACGKYTYRHVHIFLFISASRVRISFSCLLYCRLIVAVGAAVAAPVVKADGASVGGANNDVVETVDGPELNHDILPVNLANGVPAAVRQ